MIAIIDYGMGNLRSVQKTLEAVGAEACITSDEMVLRAAAKIVLPGVGAMRPAMERLKETGLVQRIHKEVALGKPFLGICLGYQLLFEKSTEGGAVKGLGLLSGTVEKFSDTVKVPQMGWNRISPVARHATMFKGIGEDPFVYFCHSYYVVPKDASVVAAWTDYGVRYASAVRRDNVWGLQFHPEKSQGVGLGILRNFVN